MTVRAFITALPLLAITAASGAQAAPKPAPLRPAAPVKTAPVKSTALQKPSPASQTRDLVYATLPGFRPLTLDLYQPPRAAKDFPKPAVIFVHGGAWSGGDARQGGGFRDFPGVLAALAAKGYVVASVNYRLSGEARFPGPVQDVKSAVRWLRAHAGDYNIDVTRVAIWGEEAGGQIASLVGTSCGVAPLEPPGSKEPSDCVQAVIGWHSVADLVSLSEGDRGLPPAGSTPQGAYLGCEPAQCAPGLTRTTNPITYIGANTPPFLLQHGASQTIPLMQSQKLYDALHAAHVPAELAVFADGEADVAAKSIAGIEAFLEKTFPRKPMDRKPPRITSKALPY